MWDHQLFRQHSVDLQFEENDKVKMLLKSSEKKKKQYLSNLVRKSSACYIISNLTFVHLEFQ